MIAERKARFWRATAGTAAIEFAILAVPFLALSLGVYEFGRACWTIEALQESAAQGARCIAIPQYSCAASGAYSASAATTYVQNIAGGWGVTLPSGDITLTQSTNCGSVAGFAQVQISYNYSTVVGALIPALKNQTINVSSCFPDNA